MNSKLNNNLGLSIQAVHQSRFFIPLVLFIFSFLSYGLYIYKLGFYWDDWPYLYLNHSQGILGYPAYMSSDRPFSAWLFMLSGYLFRENALGYHIFILALRWLCSFAFYWVLDLIWPDSRQHNFIASLLFLIYPGFLQTPIALIYSLHFSVLLMFLLSLGCMLKSAKSPKITKWSVLSIVSAFGIFSCEYFSFLELLRPILLYFFLMKTTKRPVSFNSIFRIWLPYLVIFLSFITWRVFIFRFPTYELELLQNNALPFANLVSRFFNDAFVVLLKTWGNIFSPNNFARVTNTQIVPLIFLLVTAIILALLSILSFQGKKQVASKIRSSKWQTSFIALGLSAFLLAGIPIWLTNLPIELNFAWDRLTLPFSISASLLLTAIVSKIIKNKGIEILMVSILVGFSVGFHHLNTLSYIQEWDKVNDFFWQLSSRVPRLKMGTTILTDDFPLTYYSDNSLTAPLNWLYDENNISKELNYMFYFLDVRLGRRLPALQSELTIKQPYRSFSFTGSTSDLLVLHYSPPSCLHIIDPEIDIYNNRFSKQFKQSFKLSNSHLISMEKSQIPEILEPPDNLSWCYFFQMAELARQNQDWQSILQIADDVFSKGLSPFDSLEYFPFIEAYANSNKWKSAVDLSQKVHSSDPSNDPILCALWQRILNANSMDATPTFVHDLFFLTYNCPEIL